MKCMRLIALSIIWGAVPAYGFFVCSTKKIKTVTTFLRHESNHRVVALPTPEQQKHTRFPSVIYDQIQKNLANIERWGSVLAYDNERYRGCKSSLCNEWAVAIRVEDQYNLRLSLYDESRNKLNDHADNKAIVYYSRKKILELLHERHDGDERQIKEEYVDLLRRIKKTPQQLDDDIRTADDILRHYTLLQQHKTIIKMLEAISKRLDAFEQKCTKSQCATQEKLAVLEKTSKECMKTLSVLAQKPSVCSVSKWQTP